MATWIAGETLAPPVVLVGCAVKASFAAAPAVMLNGSLVAAVYGDDVASSVYSAPTLSIRRSANCTWPAVNVFVTIPNSVPLAGLFAIAMVTATPDTVEIGLLNASVTWTSTAGAMLVPAVAPAGWILKPSFTGGPAVTVIVGSVEVTAAPLMVAFTVLAVPAV